MRLTVRQKELRTCPKGSRIFIYLSRPPVPVRVVIPHISLKCFNTPRQLGAYSQWLTYECCVQEFEALAGTSGVDKLPGERGMNIGSQAFSYDRYKLIVSDPTYIKSVPLVFCVR